MIRNNWTVLQPNAAFNEIFFYSSDPPRPLSSFLRVSMCLRRVQFFHPPPSRPQSVLHAGLPSVSTQLTAFHYLPNTVDTSMPPLDICHLKQTALIRSSTKCKYQSGTTATHDPEKHASARQGTVSFRSDWPAACSAWAPGSPETDTLNTNTDPVLKAPFCPPSLCGTRGGLCALSSWRSAKHSSDECESAATDVHTQFLGLNLCLLKNCVWTISR